MAAILLVLPASDAAFELLPWHVDADNLVVEPLSAVIAVCLLLSVFVGPPRLLPCTLDARGKPPPMQGASLMGKLTYSCYAPHVYRYYQIDRAALNGTRAEPLGVADLPPQPPGVDTASVRKAVDKPRGDTLLWDLLQVARQHAGYQFAWSICTTGMAYAPALGMKLLIDCARQHFEPQS